MPDFLHQGHGSRAGALLLAGAILAVGCSPTGRLLSNEPSPSAPRATPAPTPSRAADPEPVELPRDEFAHRRLTEWWYYTGHLVTHNELRYDFEFVIFRAERGDFPVSWASHLALTDRANQLFVYEQRSEIGPQVDRSSPEGFDFAIRGSDDRGVVADVDPWAVGGIGGEDVLHARARDFAIEVVMTDTRDAPVLHDGDGWVDFGAAGSSYYYSRPRMALSGTLEVGGRAHEVTGQAWFDHQWGDFIAVGGGGWDWFAVNLDDGTDVTLSLVRAADGSYPLVYGTLVRASGETVHLTHDQFTVTPTSSWTSPTTGAVYPSGWTLAVPGEELEISLTPTVLDQELDTRPTTGVIYWEGSQNVSATHAGEAVGGEGYVELTGYAPAE